MATPIVVEHLQLDETTFHSDTMIAAVGIDALVGHLELNSPNLNIAKGQYPLHDLQLYDAFVGIDLRDTPPDTAAQDTTPLMMAFDVPNGDLRNVHFSLTPLGLDVNTRSLQTNVLVDVGGNKYDTRRIEIGRTKLAIGSFALPIDTVYGDACVDLERQLITSNGLHVRADEMGAKADLSTTKMNLETMQVDVVGDADFKGSKAKLRARYDIDDEAYDAHVDVEKVDLSPFMKDNTRIVLTGEIDAVGKGIDINSRAMRSKVKMHLTDAIYDNINVSGLRLESELADKTVEGTLHLPFAMTGDSLQVAAQTEHQFRVADFMNIDQIRVNYNTQMRNVKAHVAGENFYAKHLDVHFDTDTTTALNLSTEGLKADLTSPMHVMQLVDQVQPLLKAVKDSASLFALIDSIPSMALQVHLTPGHPLQRYVDSTRAELRRLNLALYSDSLRKTLSIDAGACLTDGVMSLHNLRTDADLVLDVKREGDDLNGVGRLTMDNLSFGEMDLGSREVNLVLARSENYADALKADVQLDDIPLEIVDSIIKMASPAPTVLTVSMGCTAKLSTFHSPLSTFSGV